VLSVVKKSTNSDNIEMGKHTIPKFITTDFTDIHGTITDLNLGVSPHCRGYF
jgi:hypothetical protein